MWEYEITKEKSLDNKVPCYPLNEIIMDNAAACGAPGLAPVRKKTGSTDFGNVTNHMPGCCIRVKFVPTGTAIPRHLWMRARAREAHDAILYGAKTLAGTACDLICQPERSRSFFGMRLLQAKGQRVNESRNKMTSPKAEILPPGLIFYA